MSEYLPLPPSLRKRFYEPVILLDALKAVYRKDQSISEPDLESGAGKSPKQTYFCFLNKLSQICDTQKCVSLGKTVSAIVVLDSGNIEYRFASNQRDSDELDTVKEYLTGILNVLGGVSDDEVNSRAFMAPVSSRVLQTVLAFNRPRVEFYMDQLLEDDRLDFCVRSSTLDGTSDGESAAAALRSLVPHLEAARNAPRLNNDEFARHSEALLKTIDSHYASSLEEYMKKKTRGETTMVDSPWNEVRHALGRLLSYFIAIKVLISARKFWTRLFVDFEVTTIPSSEPLAEPPVIRRTAKGIITRMGRNKATIDAYQAHAEHLQSHNLDKNIQHRVNPRHFRPIVHAEVNLLDSVLREQAHIAAHGEDPLRFFNEADFGRYIGSSKPTCVLCHWYFSAHPSGVGCRETHGNLYYNWRPSEVCEADGEELAQQRLDILEGMVKDVRNEAGRAIRERTYTRRNHDSNDTPTNPLLTTNRGSSVYARAGEDGLASRMGQMSLVDWSSTTSARGGNAAGVSTVGASGMARPRGIELAARFGQANMDVSSTRGWSGDSRETTPESLAGEDDEPQVVGSPLAPRDQTPTKSSLTPTQSGLDKHKEEEEEEEEEEEDGGGARL